MEHIFFFCKLKYCSNSLGMYGGLVVIVNSKINRMFVICHVQQDKLQATSGMKAWTGSRIIVVAVKWCSVHFTFTISFNILEKEAT